MRRSFLPETIMPLGNAGPVRAPIAFGRIKPVMMTKTELQRMMKGSSFGKRRRRRKRTNTLAKKAMILHHRQGISLKEAWKRVKKLNG